MLIRILDPIPTAHCDIQTQDSLHIKLSLSLRSLLDSSLPPSSSPSPSSNLLPSSSDQVHTIISLDNVPLNLNPPQRPYMPLTRHPPPPPSGIPSSPSWTRRGLVAFLPVGSSVDSVGWPPTGCTLHPSGKNSEQDIGVRVSEIPSG